MKKHILYFILSAIFFALCLNKAFPQVNIIVLDGTNFIDYRVLNINFATLNTGLYWLAIGKVTNAPPTNGPWAQWSNLWVQIDVTNNVKKTGDEMSGNLGVPTATGSEVPTNDNQFVRLTDARKLIQNTTAFWLTTNAAGISNYYQATNTLTGGGSITVSGIDAGEYPFAWVIQSNGVSSVPIGQARLDLRVKRSAPGGPVTLKPELYIRHPAGSEPEWCETGEEIIVPIAVDDFIKSLAVNVPTNLAQDALVMLKLKSTIGSGGNVTVYVGTNAFSSIRIPTTEGGQGPPGPDTWSVVSGAVTEAANSWPAVSASVTQAASSWPTVSASVTQAASSWPAVSGAVTQAAFNALPSDDAEYQNLKTNTATKAQGLTADLALPKNFTNTGAFKEIQITGKIPTNGATWIATNKMGQGKWSWPVAFRSGTISDQTFTNAEMIVVFTGKTFDYGNNFDLTYFIAPVNGLYLITFQGFFVYFSSNATLRQQIYVNGASVHLSDSTFGTMGIYQAGTGIPLVAILDLATGDQVCVKINCSAATMIRGITRTVFSGTLIRELP